MVAADDIRENSVGRKIELWVSNDSCPPSPGCSYSHCPRPSASGTWYATVWQYAQSPRRRDFARGCLKLHGRRELLSAETFFGRRFLSILTRQTHRIHRVAGDSTGGRNA